MIYGAISAVFSLLCVYSLSLGWFEAALVFLFFAAHFIIRAFEDLVASMWADLRRTWTRTGGKEPPKR